MDRLDVVDIVDEVVPVALFWRFSGLRGVCIETIVGMKLVFVVWVREWDIILGWFVRLEA
jgi:hypothetical protein